MTKRHLWSTTVSLKHFIAYSAKGSFGRMPGRSAKKIYKNSCVFNALENLTQKRYYAVRAEFSSSSFLYNGTTRMRWYQKYFSSLICRLLNVQLLDFFYRWPAAVAVPTRRVNASGTPLPFMWKTTSEL